MATNTEAAELLREIADLLDLRGERFKPEAYRRAARSVETLTEPLAAVAARNGLREVPGIGEAIDEKLREYLAQGTIPYLERLRGEVPPGLIELMRLPGVGPKTARRFWTELGVTDRDGLARAIDAGRLDGLKGFAARKIEQTRTAVAAAAVPSPPARRPIDTVFAEAQAIRDALRDRAPTEQVEIAGSFRRGRETVGDLDVLVTSQDPERVFEVFSALPEIAEVRMRGPTKETVILRDGLQVDLRVVEPAAFGAALQYFTGSKDHNVRLRSLARDLALKVNEYGVFRADTRVAGRTEEEVYGRLGLPWIPPELREDRGEIDAARAGRLPRLVEATDLVGDLHVHLPDDPSPEALDRLAAAAAKRGLRYLGIVVAGPDRGDLRAAPVAPELTAPRTSAGRAVRLLRVVEIDRRTVESAVGRFSPDYLVLRADPSGQLPDPGTATPRPVRLVAHAGGARDGGAVMLAAARSAGAAIEVGPGPERGDSSVARAAVEGGSAVAVPTGVGWEDGAAVASIALGFARRAGATREHVANATAPGDEDRGDRPKRRRPTAR